MMSVKLSKSMKNPIGSQINPQ